MSNLLDSAIGLVGRRLLTTSWIPLFVFAGITGVLLATGVGWREVTQWWNGLSLNMQALIVVLSLAATAVMAQVLDTMRPSFIRLYEGYWDSIPGGRRAANWLIENDGGITRNAERPWTLPSPDRLMPTRLGNILRAAEQEAQRYGMDAVTAWPRLYVALPDAFTKLFAATSATFEQAITISILGAVFAITDSVIAILLLPWWSAPLCLWIGALIAWLGYRATVRSALSYGDLVRTAFDVYRWLLLDAMGLRRPTSPSNERLQWQQIHQIWQRGITDVGKAYLLGYPLSDSEAVAPQATANLEISTSVSTVETADLETSGPAPGPVNPAWPKHGRRIGHWAPISVLAVVGLVMALIAAVVISLKGPGVVATRDLPIYHVLGSSDIGRGGGKLIGHYTLEPIEKGATIDSGSLGPALPPGSLYNRVITSLKVQPTSVLLARGETIGLIAMPQASKAVAVIISDVIVLDFQGSSTVIVALAANDLHDLVTTATTYQVVLNSK